MSRSVDALSFVVSMRPAVPMSTERPCEIASNSEIRRWLDQGSVVINGVRPQAKQLITFPVTQLVFFPNSRRKKCTVY